MADYNRQEYYNYYSNSYKDYNNYNHCPYPSATQTSVSYSPQQMNRGYNQPSLSSYFRNGNPSFNHLPPNPNYNSMNQNYSTVIQNHNNPNQSYFNTIPTPLQQYANPNQQNQQNQYYNEQSLNQHFYNSNVHNGYSYYARQQYQQREYAYSNGNTQNPPVVQQQASTNSEFDAQEEFGDKLISYARFNRNNELMKTIVSDVVVPDVSTYVTSNRLKVLSDQVHALKTHQKKVAIEIDEIDKDFKTKKQELNEKAIKFQEEYKKLCEPALTSEDFEDMVNKSYDALKRNMELLKWQKTLAWAHETAAASGTVTTAKSEPLLAEILAATPLM